MAMALGLYIFNIVWTTGRQFMRAQRRAMRRAGQSDTATETNTVTTTDTDGMDDVEKNVNYDTFLAHTINQLLLLVVNVAWFAQTNPTEAFVTAIFCVYIAVAGCVLIVEMRVRKSEVQHGLLALDSKKTFVR
jgi:hypothetical protein